MNRIVQHLSHPAISSSSMGIALRHLLRRIDRFVELPLELRVQLNLSRRPSYAYCAYHAAVLAKRLGLDALSLIEFGVAGGNGLAFLDQFAEQIERTLQIGVQVYGFDSGRGLPAVAQPEDLPYWFRESSYRIDLTSLRQRLTRSKLIIGDVRDTIKGFFEEHHPAPIGAIMNDLDLCSSTSNSFSIFDTEPRHFLPRVFMYFDDIIGTEIEMYSEAVGELRAIRDFNAVHPEIHIGRSQTLLPRYDVSYRHQIYYAHLKVHPLYGVYVGGGEQSQIESALRLDAAA